MPIDATVLILSITTITGVVGNLVQYCYKSKCSKISVCFGLVKIDRNIQKEVNNDHHHVDNNDDDDFGFEMGTIYQQPQTFHTQRDNPTFKRHRSKSI
jgi:hypothetical protein